MGIKRMMNMLNDKDLRIIEILLNDARTPYTRIADELGVTEAAIRKRVKNLEEKGVIKKYTIEVDHSKLGYGIVSQTGIDTEPDRFLEVANRLKDFDFVKSVHITSGDHMIMAEIWARDGQELTEIISEKIGGLEGVRRICPAIVLERIK